VTAAEAVVAIGIGLVAGILSGMFGVGGGIVMTPGIETLLGTSPIVAVETPLPVILPTALVGASTYRRAGEIDTRAAAWMIPPGVVGAIAGALLTLAIRPQVLLIVTAALLAYQSLGILRGSRPSAQARPERPSSPAVLGSIGFVAGGVSGLLGIGGGLVIVPLLAGWRGMPLKRALGTSLLTIVALVIPGTVVHAALGNIDWAIAVAVTVGAVPGAWFGARLALGTAEHTLRRLVGGFLLAVALLYGAAELLDLAGG
jgi:uncharacterized membrane protein YfcA